MNKFHKVKISKTNAQAFIPLLERIIKEFQTRQKAFDSVGISNTTATKLISDGFMTYKTGKKIQAAHNKLLGVS